MRILVNTLSIDPSKGGIRIFLLGLLAELVRLPSAEKVILAIADYNEELFTDLIALPNVTAHRVSGVTKSASSRILADQLKIRTLADDADVLLTPSNIASLGIKIPQVVVLQAPLAIKSIRSLPYVPEGLVSRFHRFYYDLGIPLTIAKADRVIAVSEFLREKVAEDFPKHTAKLKVVHEGVSFDVIERPEAFQSDDFVLFVSSVFPYKNAGKLIEAFGKFDHQSPNPGSTRLVICGKDPDKRQFERLRAIAADAGVADQLELRGQVSHDVLKDLYARCRLFVYPSSVETFGLPILEAMALGAPVICSDKMSVPEVAGDAAIVVDPMDTNALAAEILRVHGDAGLQRELTVKGYKRVRDFSWTRCATEISAILEQAVKDSK